MDTGTTVDLSSLLICLSDAMDLASPDISQHQLRTAYTAWQTALEADLPREVVADVFVAALLHDMGVMSPEERIRIHRFETNDNGCHCLRGEWLLSQVPWLKPASKIVRHHHRTWSSFERGIDDPGVLQSQLVLLADRVERLVDRSKYILHQSGDILSQVVSMAGEALHPQVVEHFRAAAATERFWLDLASPRLHWLLLEQGPYRSTEISLENTLSFARLIKNTIDFRSHFTATHSSGVAAGAAELARLLGFATTEIRLIKIAGYLHDLGKLAVPNSIIDKQGKLTSEEFAIIKQHTYYTRQVLSGIRGAGEDCRMVGLSS